MLARSSWARAVGRGGTPVGVGARVEAGAGGRWGVVGGRARAAPTAATAALAVVLLAVVGRAAASLIRVAIAA